VIGPLIREVRLARGIRQSDFARQLGMWQSSLSRLEAGQGSMSVERLAQVLALLDVDLEALLRRELLKTKGGR